MTRTGWSAVALGVALVAAGVATGYRAPSVFGATALVCVAVGLLWVRSGQELTVTRSIEPARVTVGDPAIAHLVVSNAGNRTTLPMRATDELTSGRIERSIPSLTAESDVDLSYQLPTGRRGVFAVGPLRTLRGDPWRLVEAEKVHGATETLIVHPRAVPLVTLPPSQHRSLEAPTTDSATHGTQTFHQLRDYVQGDDRRMIHWKSYARTGTLVVRQNVDTSLPELAVVVDLRSSRHSDSSFEVAVEVAASLLLLCTQRNFPTVLCLSDGSVLSAPPGGDAGTFFLDRLASVQLVPDASGTSDLRPLVQNAASAVSGQRLVVVTGRPQAPDMASIAILARRCSQTFVVDTNVDSTPVSARGVTLLSASSLEEFAELWNQGGFR